jgi:SRSO17 transposase
MVVLPISDIPTPLREFAQQFRNVFKHPAQREYFEIILAGLIASENRTLAGIHQRLVEDIDYGGLHHFMSDSPWSHDGLRQARLEWTAKRLKSDSGSPKVIAIDSTLLHHYGDQIHGVYWYYDYVKHNFCLGQKLVAATYVSPGITVPLGMEVYHRGFLNEQKLYLQETKPAPTAIQEEWDEYNSLVKKYEENCNLHRTQLDLAGELVDECERHEIPVDVYVLDGAFLDVDLMDKIESHERGWVTRLAKNRLIQLRSGKFDTVEALAKSLSKENFKPVTLKTKSGEERTYWVFGTNTKVKFWKKLRVVISYDNPELEGEPRFFVSNKLNWIQAQKILQPYLFRDPIEHFFRDSKQELGFESCQQRKKQAVLRYWELCFLAYAYLELVCQVDYPEGMMPFEIDTIGQKCRSTEMNLLQAFITTIKNLILEGRDPKELLDSLTKKRLNGFAC